MTTILLLALLGTVISIAVGTVWYSPGLPTGKIHMKYLGFDKLSHEEQQKQIEASKPMMPKIYLGQTVLSFLTSLAVVFITTTSIENGVPSVMVFGFVLVNWLAFMVPVVGSNILWGNCDGKLAWKKFFSDSGSFLVTMLLIAGVTLLFVA